MVEEIGPSAPPPRMERPEPQPRDDEPVEEAPEAPPPPSSDGTGAVLDIYV